MSAHEHTSMHKRNSFFTSSIFLRLVFAIAVSVILVLAIFATSAH